MLLAVCMEPHGLVWDKLAVNEGLSLTVSRAGSVIGKSECEAQVYRLDCILINN